MSKPQEGFVFYRQTLKACGFLSDIELGQTMKAVIQFLELGEYPDGFTDAQMLLFDMFRSDIEKSKEKYDKTCERNKRNRNSGNKPSPAVTNGVQQNRAEQEQNLNELDRNEPYWRQATQNYIDQMNQN